MSGNFDSPSPMQPLSVGNVVSAGVRLYRSHLKSYFSLAVIVCLWSMLPFLFFVPSGIILYVNLASGRNSPLNWLIVSLIGLGLSIYALGKSLVNSATISRLAFGELVNQPETVKQARNQIQPRMWTLVINVFLLFLIYLGLSIFFVFLLLIPLLNILLLIPITAILTWFVARFFLADILIAIEENIDAVAAISRSWDLSQTNAWRIALILFVSFLITIPFQLLTQLVSRGVMQSLILPRIQEAISGSNSAISFIITVYLIVLGLSFLVGAALLPFWQTVKAVIYYDLRSRREGLGLQLRDREI
ncbi:MAG: DUF975 domain-containing protein [Nostoc sp. TH1S01]|nr:DUF975 domain-containing protein [Nostoc sp. TH1S01]